MISRRSPHAESGRLRLGTRRARRGTTVLVVMLGLIGGLASCGGSANSQPRTSTKPASATTGRHDPPTGPWLGLNYNSGAHVGHLKDFSAAGVVYDRLGALETAAGETVRNTPQLAAGLAQSVKAGMIPDIVVNSVRGPSGCTDNPNTSDLCLPVSQSDIAAYVRGFVTTVDSIRAAYPHAGIIFEPTDEPWSWGAPLTQPGRPAAQKFANLLAPLLTAARAAKIPLSAIYVPATGTLEDGSSWISDLYSAQPCLGPGPHSCGPISGWNLHPYGPPGSSEAGINSVPRLRASMSSGQNNIVVSEIGFCATNVDAGAKCHDNRPDIVVPSARAATWLQETLAAAAGMHRAGWLKAMIIWVRSGGGWSMQTSQGRLTSQGQTLLNVARTSACAAARPRSMITGRSGHRKDHDGLRCDHRQSAGPGHP